ncbi:MAG: hypothetical protein K0S09_320 [Sphingobacteriaceae bacterium]|jgi:hypothetical protein|nr:hypothetical protein [Sphingobacteriaceae bacterium]
MAEPNKINKEPIDREDEIDARISDPNETDKRQVDAIRTGNSKKDDYHDKPFDEQMYNSFDELREQQGSQPEDEEAD